MRGIIHAGMVAFYASVGPPEASRKWLLLTGAEFVTADFARAYCESGC